MSRKVMGQSRKKPSASCPSTILLTRSRIDWSVYSVSERDEASTESAIMSIACSRVKGLGPGYVKRSSSTSESGLSFLYFTKKYFVLPWPWCVLMKSRITEGRLYLSAIFSPSVTWLIIICALSIYDRFSCGFTPDWFSVKYIGLFILPMSW